MGDAGAANTILHKVTMKKAILAVLFLSSPAWAQNKPVSIKPVNVTSNRGADDCKPIGQTADRKLVYSMKCENLPAPPVAERVPESQVVEAPEEESKGGMFRFPFSGTSLGVNRTPQIQGVGPGGSR